MSAISDIQQALNAIRQSTDEANWQTRLEVLELILSTSASIVSRARQLTEPKTKTRTVTIPKTRVVKRVVDVPPPPKPAPAKPSLAPIRPQPPRAAASRPAQRPQ